MDRGSGPQKFSQAFVPYKSRGFHDDMGLLLACEQRGFNTVLVGEALKLLGYTT